MKTPLVLFFLLVISFTTNAQVGIGTATPNSSAMLEVSTTSRGILFPRMSSVQRVAIASPALGLYVFDTNTNSLWLYNGAVWINTVTEANYGDVKSGFQSADHSGWIKLDGRAVSSLSTAQRSAAATLGFSANLPNAASAYLTQSGGAMGSLSGSNTLSLTQGNLPSVNFTGTSGSGGSHTHDVDPGLAYTSTNGNHQHYTSFNNDDYNGMGGGNQSLEDDGGVWSNRYTSWAGDHYHSIDIPNTRSTTADNHTHLLSISSGGSGTALTISPLSL